MKQISSYDLNLSRKEFLLEDSSLTSAGKQVAKTDQYFLTNLPVFIRTVFVLHGFFSNFFFNVDFKSAAKI